MVRFAGGQGEGIAGDVSYVLEERQGGFPEQAEDIG
jgi:hypothetical protein